MAVCRECGTPYGAKRKLDEIILPTDDGRCRCGGSEFDVPEDDVVPTP